MLYTVLPLEEVLEGLEEDPPRTIQLAVGEITVEAEPLGSFQARVVRVFEHGPQAFSRAPLPAGQHNPRSDSLGGQRFSYGQI